MASSGDTKEYYKFLTEDSVNVGDDGNFSVQVLQAALQKRNLSCIPLTGTNYYSVVVNLSQENGFICNRGAHWFSIRKVIPGEWYNFNSLLNEPEHLPESHLASFLDDLFDKEDVCIYAIKGNLPSISPSNRPTTSSSGRWSVATGSNREEFELKYAIELSKVSAGMTETNAPSSSSSPSPSSSQKSETEIFYPKLPDFSDEKITYPTLEPLQEEQPLTFKSRSQPPPPPLPKVDTKDLSFNDHLRLVNDYFGRCVYNMEKMDQRLSVLEQSFAKMNQKK